MYNSCPVDVMDLGDGADVLMGSVVVLNRQMLYIACRAVPAIV